MDLILVLTALAAAHLVAMVSPGPSFLVVARTAVAQSRRAGLWVALGAGLGAAVWAGAALFGLKAVFVALPPLYTALKLGGAAYLLFLAYKAWRHASDPLPVANVEEAGRTVGWEAFRRGLLTQLANPKAAIFFGSVFVALIPGDAPLAFYSLVLAYIAVIETLWYAFVGVALTVGPMQSVYGRAKTAIDRITGAVMGALGVKLLVD